VNKCRVLPRARILGQDAVRDLPRWSVYAGASSRCKAPRRRASRSARGVAVPRICRPRLAARMVDRMAVLPAFMSCPHYHSCSANDCPLDPDAAMHGGRRFSLPGEEVCRARRRVRERVAAGAGLPPGFALLLHERVRAARRAAWKALPAEERKRRAAGLWRGAGPVQTGICEVMALERPPGTPGGGRSGAPVCMEVP
jgi:hypothetical protein